MDKTTLQYFKTTLETRMEVLQNHIHTVTHSITELHTQTSGDHADIISTNTQGMLNCSILSQCEAELRDINYSLSKIRKNTFGICEMCGDDIDEERLKIKPHAKYCIICREIYEKANKG